MNPLTPYKLLLVDDNALFLRSARDCIEAVFAGTPRALVLATADSGAEALQQISLDRPDLVLTDLHMPEMNGVEVTRRIKSATHPPSVVLMSLSDRDELGLAAEIAGADAFLSKLALAEQLPGLLSGGFDGVAQ